MTREEYIKEKKKAIALEVMNTAKIIASLVPPSKNKRAFRKTFSRKPTKDVKAMNRFQSLFAMELMRYRIDVIKAQPIPKYPSSGSSGNGIAMVGEMGEEVIIQQDIFTANKSKPWPNQTEPLTGALRPESL